MRVLRSATPPVPAGILAPLRHHCWEAPAILALGWFLLAAGMALAKVHHRISFQQIVDPSPLRGPVRR
jgi:hypothetical protein